MHSTYLRIRLSRTSRLTLSVNGVSRAIARGRLPRGQALLEELGIWVPLEQHPVIAGLLESLSRPSCPKPGQEDPVPDTDGSEPAEIILVSSRAAEDESRRQPVRPSRPAQVFVAGASTAGESELSAWKRHVRGIQRWAAAL